MSLQRRNFKILLHFILQYPDWMNKQWNRWIRSLLDWVLLATKYHSLISELWDGKNFHCHSYMSLYLLCNHSLSVFLHCFILRYLVFSLREGISALTFCPSCSQSDVLSATQKPAVKYLQSIFSLHACTFPVYSDSHMLCVFRYSFCDMELKHCSPYKPLKFWNGTCACGCSVQ